MTSFSYVVRFENCTSEQTRIKFMTEGILLREAMNNKLLDRYQCIILDEAHERTINTDVLFGIIKKIQKQRKLREMSDLKVIIMSATMDVDHFSKYFDNCPVLYLPGRTHQVKVNHTKQRQEDYLFGALVTLFEIHKTAPVQHDVLMFLTGKDEIDSMIHQIRTIAKSQEITGHYPPLRAWPLHSSLPPQKQFEAFQRSGDNFHNYRRVIVSTNIAETSVTIPGIKYVIDTGVVKMKKYDPVTGLDSLRVSKISQAQAWQRTGRAGRESEGICYRVFTAKEYDNFEKMTTPEILRCNLATSILQLLATGVNIETFDFIDKPPRESIEIAFKQLKQLGAIKSAQNPQLTETGRRMAMYPLDPTYSKIILSSQKFECVSEIHDLISILSSDNIFCEPGQNNRDQAIAQHSKFQTHFGDHLTLLNVYTQYQKHKASKVSDETAGERVTDSLSLFQQWCNEHFLNHKTLQYASEVRKQLSEISHSLGMNTEKDSQVYNVDQVSNSSRASSLGFFPLIFLFRLCLVSSCFLGRR